ncbi:MAG: hypothetical protein U0946_05735 [Patescibacteria group bacterium]|nr:hypothetical protein [Patescibacteria group bacterium]
MADNYLMAKRKVKVKKKIKLRQVFLGVVGGLTGLGLLLGVILVGTETKIASEAKGKQRCSSREGDEVCRGKKVGQLLRGQGTCEDSRRNDKKDMPVCVYREIKNNDKGKKNICVVWREADRKCDGQSVGTKFGNKYCKEVGTNNAGSPMCYLSYQKNYATPENLKSCPYPNKSACADWDIELWGYEFDCYSEIFDKKRHCCAEGQRWDWVGDRRNKKGQCHY